MFLELNFGAADAVDDYLPPKMLELEEACPLQSPVPSVISYVPQTFASYNLTWQLANHQSQKIMGPGLCDWAELGQVQIFPSTL